MTSCILFHGPDARQAALAEAQRLGRLMAPPFGDAGLKVDEARQFVGLMNSTPVGVGVGVVIAGPLDDALPKSSDVLLKCIEEFNPAIVVPVLWANDLGGVMGTICSRCLDRWCPGELQVDETITKAAVQLVAASLGERPWKIPSLVSSVLPRDKKESQRANLRQLLGELSEVLVPQMGNPKARELWVRLRKVTAWWSPTVPELVAALFPVEGGC